eukprot:scaffold20.g7662.t1
MGPSDDLSLLMPRIQQQAIHTTSENTAALREYVMVARGNAQPQPLAASNVPRRTRLALREGTGRVPQKRPFAIRVRVEELEQEQHKLHDDAVQLDPDELMEALLAQARQQRQVMLAQVLRLGTRQHVRRPFSIMLDPVVEPEPEPEPEPETVEQEEPEGDAAAAAATPGLHLLSAGRLLQAASSRLGQLRTPGSLLQGRYTPIEGVPERLLLTARPRQPSAAATASRSRLTAATPAGFTPMEGVPERLVSAQLLSGLRRCMGPGSSRMQSNGLAEHGGVDSPVEGLVQEGAHRGSAAQPVPADEFAFAAPAGGSGEGSELSDGRDDGPGAVDEPVPSARSPSGGFPLLAGAHSPARMADAGAQTGLSLKSQEQADRREAGTQAEASPPGMADAALQTGRSLRSPEKGEAGWAVAVAIDAAGGDAEPGEDPGTTVEDHNAGKGERTEVVLWHGRARCCAPGTLLADFAPRAPADGGFDDDDWDDDGAGDDGADAALEQPLQQPEASEAWEQADHWPEDQGQEDTAPSAERQPPKRRRTTLPGSRLRNELGKRKSLAIRSDMGRQEVAPGVRRSTRSREQPLKWWLNECKEYGREHTTLPTVKDVRHVKPNTPWRTVADPVASFRRKKARRAPTPQELELGVQPEGEDVEEEHEAQERQEEAMERGDEEAAAEGADGTEEGVKDEEREEQLQAGGGSDDEREREEEVDEEQPAARQVRHKQRSRQPKAAKKAAARAKRKGRR